MIDTIAFLVTDVCNLRCKYCYLGDKRKKIGSDDFSNVIPTAKELLRIYKDEKIIGIRFYGAEPLTCPVEIITEAMNIVKPILDDKRGAIEITTNGTLATKEYIDYIVKNCKSPIRWTVSIDGPEWINDKYRGRGTYKKAMSGLFNIAERGFNVRVQSVYSDELMGNPEVFEEWERMIRGLGFRIGFLWRRGEPLLPDDLQEKWADYCIEKNRLNKELKNHKGQPFCYRKDGLNARYHAKNGKVELCHLFENDVDRSTTFKNKSLKDITISLVQEPVKQQKNCEGCVAWDYCKGLCPFDKPVIDINCAFLKRVFSKLGTEQGKSVDEVMKEFER